MLGFLPTRAYRPGTPGATTFLSPLSGTFNYGWDSFPLGPTRLEIDRAELTRVLAQYDAVATSTAYSDVLRNEGGALAGIIRERLSAGDFRTGDEIALFIEGGEAAQWDTLMVEAGPLVDVPTLGPILLHGVLRSELETHLTTELGRFIQTPRIQARALIRVSVAGAVGRPGFYALPTDLRLSDVVTLAGGPQGGADPGRIRVERGEDELWSFEELLAPVAEGRTLNDIGLQPGDRIILVQGSTTSRTESVLLQQTIRTFSYIAIPALLGFIIR